jgi:hypothetical protein
VSDRRYEQRRFHASGHMPTVRSGWITYLAPPYAGRISPPSTALVEHLPDGSLLLLSTEEPFSADDPAHVAAADTIQASLAPLDVEPPRPQATERPRHKPMRSRPRLPGTFIHGEADEVR